MANIFNEVDEDIRKERYQNLWSKYGKYLIGSIVLIILIFSTTQYLKSKKISDNKKILDTYFSAVESIEKNELDLAIRDLKNVYSQKNNILSAISGYKISEIYLKNDEKEKSLLALDEIISNASLELIYRELALYKYIMIDFDNINPSYIEDKVNSIKTPETILTLYFEQIIAIKHLTLGNINKANLILTSLLLNEDTPYDLRIRLDKLIQIAK